MLQQIVNHRESKQGVQYKLILTHLTMLTYYFFKQRNQKRRALIVNGINVPQTVVLLQNPDFQPPFMQTLLPEFYGLNDTLQFLGCAEGINYSSEMLMLGTSGVMYLYSGGQLKKCECSSQFPLQLELDCHVDRKEISHPPQM